MTGTKNLFSKKATLYTYMDDSAALAPSSPVRINGIIAGKVKKVAFSGETAPRRIIRVDMEVEKDLLPQIPIDSIASISSENVLGAKFINIKKGQSRVTVQPGAEIQSLDTREFDEVVQQGYTLLSSLQGILTRVDEIVGLRGKRARQYRQASGRRGALQPHVGGDLGRAEVTHALTTPQGTVGKLIYDDALYGDIRTSMGRLDSLLAGLQQGQGTAGRILKDEASISGRSRVAARAAKLDGRSECR